MLYGEKTAIILGAFYKVYNALGFGFLERVYENALCFELRRHGFAVEQQKRIDVHYEGVQVGWYAADVLVDETIILEIKAAHRLAVEHEQQLLNYLKATNIELGLLLNFGHQPQHRRKINTPRQAKKQINEISA